VAISPAGRLWDQIILPVLVRISGPLA
jgi:hypothetical protein